MKLNIKEETLEEVENVLNDMRNNEILDILIEYRDDLGYLKDIEDDDTKIFKTIFKKLHINIDFKNIEDIQDIEEENLKYSIIDMINNMDNMNDLLLFLEFLEIEVEDIDDEDEEEY